MKVKNINVHVSILPVALGGGRYFVGEIETATEIKYPSNDGGEKNPLAVKNLFGKEGWIPWKEVVADDKIIISFYQIVKE